MTFNINYLYFFILRFPIGNVPLLNAWLKAMDYDESFFITQETFLCSDHFKKEDLIFKNGVWNVTNKAVPSNFRYKIIVRSLISFSSLKIILI